MRKFESVDKQFLKYEKEVIKMPERATMHSAGYDFYSPIDVVIEPQQMQMIWTNVKSQFNEDEVLLLCVTSGMGKYGIMLANTLGVIDSDYYSNDGNDGNIGFRLYNFSDKPYIIKSGDKIGQGIFTKFLTVDNESKVEKIRKGGFGSTNKQK